MTAANEFLLHHFCLRAIKQLPIEGRFDFRIAARNRIAYYNAVGRRVEVLRLIAGHRFDSQRLQHGGHRRIDILVRSGDAMAARLKHTGQRRHRGPADSDQVIVHLLLVVSSFPQRLSLNEYLSHSLKSKGHQRLFNISVRKISRPGRGTQPRSRVARDGSTSITRGSATRTNAGSTRTAVLPLSLK